ncbi:MAG: Uma2 family endonuclease [Lachnospiraceae bacterium]|nr:Uma2 family endonuclease [Lachnospiraceae bacterium]
MSAQPQEKMYTIDDIEALPEGQRAELIDGVIYDMATPSTQHQRIVHHLDRMIGNYIADGKGSCEVFPAPFAVYLSQDTYNYFEPDLTVVCDSSKLDDKGCHGAPDWIIEIVSPSSRSMDYIVKMFRYSAAGVREYWIVDPEKDSITVYDFNGKSGGSYTMSDVIPVGIYDGDLQIDFSALNI